MIVEELIIYGKTKIHSTHSKMLLANLLNVNPLELLNYLDKEVSEEIIDKYKKQVSALVEKKPIQYVIGTVNFYGNIFTVTEDTLIPRFETEELVENTLLLIEEIFDKKDLNIIDLGTGTGCIGITLKKQLPSSNITLLDISKQALMVAEENAKKLEVQINIINNDMLEGITDKYDVIISNPPYIKTGEKIQDIVRENEPHLALYAGEDGLDCYRKILKSAVSNVNDKYLITLEIGEEQKEDIIYLAKKYFPDANIISKKDMQNRDRMIFIYRK